MVIKTKRGLDNLTICQRVYFFSRILGLTNLISPERKWKVMISEMVLHKSTSFKLLKEIAIQCSAYRSDIYIIKGHRKADAKDILDLVTLSLHPSDRIALIVEGPDAEDAGEKVTRLLN